MASQGDNQAPEVLKDDPVRAVQVSELQEHRRSERKRRSKQPVFSPDDFVSRKKSAATEASGPKKRRIVRRNYRATSAADRPYDVLPNGEPFSCDLCQSPYVCDPLLSKKGLRGKRSRHMPSPRQKLNPVTGKMLVLCNACAKSMDGPRPAKPVVRVSQEVKDAYITKAKAFAAQLSARLKDPEGDRLYCPSYKKVPCGCLQKYLGSEENADQIEERGKELLSLYRQAKKLAAEKVYNVEEVTKKLAHKKRKVLSVGLGNGNKRSRRFEAFILEHRVHLKNDLHLCERAVQKILCYSNNFLHKKLKTDERGCRVVRQKGKAALGLLDPFETLGKRHCCVDQCVRMVYSHRNLLSHWRKRAVSSQNEARRVLAEMLTPCGGVRSNCYKFISWVTGCSHSTLSKVREQMRRTRGEREPPPHGLYRYWRARNRDQPCATATSDEAAHGFSDGAGTSAAVLQGVDASSLGLVPGDPQSWQPGISSEMESQRRELLQLQDQLLQCQASITQQQQHAQQQFVAHGNAQQQTTWTHSAMNLATIHQQMLQQMSELQSVQQNLASTMQSLQQQIASLQPPQPLASQLGPPAYPTQQPNPSALPVPMPQPQAVTQLPVSQQIPQQHQSPSATSLQQHHQQHQLPSGPSLQQHHQQQHQLPSDAVLQQQQHQLPSGASLQQQQHQLPSGAVLQQQQHQLPSGASLQQQQHQLLGAASLQQQQHQQPSVPCPSLQPVQQHQQLSVPCPSLQPVQQHQQPSVPCPSLQPVQQHQQPSVPCPSLQPVQQHQQPSVPCPSLQPVQQVPGSLSSVGPGVGVFGSSTNSFVGLPQQQQQQQCLAGPQGSVIPVQVAQSLISSAQLGVAQAQSAFPVQAAPPYPTIPTAESLHCARPLPAVVGSDQQQGAGAVDSEAWRAKTQPLQSDGLCPVNIVHHLGNGQQFQSTGSSLAVQQQASASTVGGQFPRQQQAYFQYQEQTSANLGSQPVLAAPTFQPCSLQQAGNGGSVSFSGQQGMVAQPLSSVAQSWILQHQQQNSAAALTKPTLPPVQPMSQSVMFTIVQPGMHQQSSAVADFQTQAQPVQGCVGSGVGGGEGTTQQPPPPPQQQPQQLYHLQLPPQSLPQLPQHSHTQQHIVAHSVGSSQASPEQGHQQLFRLPPYLVSQGTQKLPIFVTPAHSVPESHPAPNVTVTSTSAKVVAVPDCQTQQATSSSESARLLVNGTFPCNSGYAGPAPSDSYVPATMPESSLQHQQACVTLGGPAADPLSAQHAASQLGVAEVGQQQLIVKKVQNPEQVRQPKSRGKGKVTKRAQQGTATSHLLPQTQVENGSQKAPHFNQTSQHPGQTLDGQHLILHGGLQTKAAADSLSRKQAREKVQSLPVNQAGIGCQAGISVEGASTGVIKPGLQTATGQPLLITLPQGQTGGRLLTPQHLVLTVANPSVNSGALLLQVLPGGSGAVQGGITAESSGPTAESSGPPAASSAKKSARTAKGGSKHQAASTKLKASDLPSSSPAASAPESLSLKGPSSSSASISNASLPVSKKSVQAGQKTFASVAVAETFSTFQPKTPLSSELQTTSERMFAPVKQFDWKQPRKPNKQKSTAKSRQKAKCSGVDATRGNGAPNVAVVGTAAQSQGLPLPGAVGMGGNGNSVRSLQASVNTDAQGTSLMLPAPSIVTSQVISHVSQTAGQRAADKGATLSGKVAPIIFSVLPQANQPVTNTPVGMQAAPTALLCATGKEPRLILSESIGPNGGSAAPRVKPATPSPVSVDSAVGSVVTCSVSGTPNAPTCAVSSVLVLQGLTAAQTLASPSSAVASLRSAPTLVFSSGERVASSRTVVPLSDGVTPLSDGVTPSEVVMKQTSPACVVSQQQTSNTDQHPLPKGSVGRKRIKNKGEAKSERSASNPTQKIVHFDPLDSVVSGRISQVSESNKPSNVLPASVECVRSSSVLIHSEGEDVTTGQLRKARGQLGDRSTQSVAERSPYTRLKEPGKASDWTAIAKSPHTSAVDSFATVVTARQSWTAETREVTSAAAAGNVQYSSPLKYKKASTLKTPPVPAEAENIVSQTPEQTSVSLGKPEGEKGKGSTRPQSRKRKTIKEALREKSMEEQPFSAKDASAESLRGHYQQAAVQTSSAISKPSDSSAVSTTLAVSTLPAPTLSLPSQTSSSFAMPSVSFSSFTSTQTIASSTAMATQVPASFSSVGGSTQLLGLSSSKASTQPLVVPSSSVASAQPLVSSASTLCTQPFVPSPVAPTLMPLCSTTPEGDGKRQVMCITSPMNFQQLQSLLSQLQLPVGSVIKQLTSPVKGAGNTGVGLAEVTLPGPQGHASSGTRGQRLSPGQGQAVGNVAEVASPGAQYHASLESNGQRSDSQGHGQASERVDVLEVTRTSVSSVSSEAKKRTESAAALKTNRIAAPRRYGQVGHKKGSPKPVHSSVATSRDSVFRCPVPELVSTDQTTPPCSVSAAPSVVSSSSASSHLYSSSLVLQNSKQSSTATVQSAHGVGGSSVQPTAPGTQPSAFTSGGTSTLPSVSNVVKVSSRSPGRQPNTAMLDKAVPSSAGAWPRQQVPVVVSSNTSTPQMRMTQNAGFLPVAMFEGPNTGVKAYPSSATRSLPGQSLPSSLSSSAAPVPLSSSLASSPLPLSSKGFRQAAASRSDLSSVRLTLAESAHDIAKEKATAVSEHHQLALAGKNEHHRRYGDSGSVDSSAGEASKGSLKPPVGSSLDTGVTRQPRKPRSGRTKSMEARSQSSPKVPVYQKAGSAKAKVFTVPTVTGPQSVSSLLSSSNSSSSSSTFTAHGDRDRVGSVVEAEMSHQRQALSYVSPHCENGTARKAGSSFGLSPTKPAPLPRASSENEKTTETGDSNSSPPPVLHMLSNVPHVFATADSTVAGAAPTYLPATAATAAASLAPGFTTTSHHYDPHPFYTSAVVGAERWQSASPFASLSLAEMDDGSRDVEFLTGPNVFPFLSASSSRSRNSSGASSIEPSITLDPALLPCDLMQIMAHQGLALAVTEVAPFSAGSGNAASGGGLHDDSN